MYRIDTPNAVGTIPPPEVLGVESFFANGAAGGSDGTTVDADWLNMLQESLLHLIDEQSIPHSKTDYGGLTAAIAAKIASEAATPPAATTSVPGIAELATDLEFQAGSDTSRAVTPSNWASLINEASGNGYLTWPTRLGFTWRFQWMLGQNASDGAAITLPAAFLNTGYSLFVAGLEDNSGAENDVRGIPISTTQFGLDIATAEDPLDFCVFAVGLA